MDTLDESYFTEEGKIPLIKFDRDQDQIVDTLNSLLHYATLVSSDKDFRNRDHYKRRLQLYTMKIGEGIRLGKSMGGDNYFMGELSRIEQVTNSINEKVKSKGLRGTIWKIIKYAVAAILILTVIQKCRG